MIRAVGSRAVHARNPTWNCGNCVFLDKGKCFVEPVAVPRTGSSRICRHFVLHDLGEWEVVGRLSWRRRFGDYKLTVHSDDGVSYTYNVSEGTVLMEGGEDSGVIMAMENAVRTASALSQFEEVGP